MKLKGKFIVVTDKFGDNVEQAFQVIGRHGYSLLVRSVHRWHRPGETWVTSLASLARFAKLYPNRVLDDISRSDAIPRNWWVALKLCEPYVPPPLGTSASDILGVASSISKISNISAEEMLR